MKELTNIRLIFKIYCLVAVVFFCFRLLLFFSEIDKVDDLSLNFLNICKAFFMGVRFDVVISGYILILPYTVFSIATIIRKPNELLKKMIFFYVFILFSLSFLICAIDIPYFNQFFSRFSVSAFQWFDSPAFVFKMIIEEPRYWMYILPLIVLIIIFFKSLKRIFSNETQITSQKRQLTLKILFSVLFLGLIILGIRGRLEQKSPIRIGTAYFSDNAFLNQLGLNPVFTLMKSYFDSKSDKNKSIKLIDEKLAISKVQSYLSITKPDAEFPLARKVISDSITSLKPNVVLIIMESMSAAKMGRHGNKLHLTPFLDSLSYNSYYFENIYTAGKHTYNGIFSSLFSFPALFSQHPMKETKIIKYNGIANTLKKLGYSTTYITTHDGQFDNVEGFLRANDFENIITQSDYPSEEIKTTLGVPDDYMFRFSIPILNNLSKSKKPFFTAFMTASDHGPIYIPEYFIPKNKNSKDGIVEYADWSLKQFIELATKQTWFKNTLFVFIADHGAAINTTYEMSLDYHHSPLIFYAPAILKENKTFNQIGGQIDVFPTIMSILKQPYLNNTLGIDLFTENRPYIFINGDDKFGVLDKEYFLIVRTDGSSSLYKYQNNDKIDYLKEYPLKAKEMEEYGKSNLQVFQYVTDKGKQFVK